MSAQWEESSGTDRATPWWVYAVALILASIEPVTHQWLARLGGEETVHSGLHTADSAIYLHAMDMFQTGYYSPYATCKAAEGPNDPALFPAPFHWLYGLVGSAGHLAGIDAFTVLGIANGLGGFFCLLALYSFFRAIAGVRANGAFLILTLSGGLGGIAYLIALAGGFTGGMNFENWFSPLSMYELVEGPYLSPVLHMPRLYYTLSLALGYAAMTAFIHALRLNCRRHLWFAAFLLLGCGLVNARFGCFFVIVLALYLVFGLSADAKSATRWRAFGVSAASAGVAATLSLWFMSRSDVFTGNTGALVRESMGPVPFVCTTLFHLLLIPPVIRGHLNSLNGPARTFAFALIGYLSFFMLLYTAHQLYYGNPPDVGAGAAALRISDWALIGAVCGALYSRRGNRHPGHAPNPDAWLSLWFLLFLAIALSAFGQGWFLRWTPQRLMVFLGPPLALLTLSGIDHIRKSSPQAARAAWSVLITCGCLSIITAALFFQGPLLRQSEDTAFAALHPEIMSLSDQHLIASIPDGVVLAPWSFSDVCALRPGLQVIGGTGSTDLSDQMSVHLKSKVDEFFSAATTPERRHAFVREWCVDTVYCPETQAIDASVIASLRVDSRFEWIAGEGNAHLFRAIVAD